MRKLFMLAICIVAVLTISFPTAVTSYYWQRVGCHQVGHTRRIRIPGCVEFDITTNACRGFCTSYGTPSPEATVKANPNQLLTSFSKCCNIMDTEDISVEVMCLNGLRDLVFKSATSCSCFHCLK
uniref:U1-Hypotoxin-Hsp1a_1 n=1 Tax=Hypochilus sp. SGP-2016 TaxID=1905178 RepID=A0A482Z948_9ARAC